MITVYGPISVLERVGLLNEIVFVEAVAVVHSHRGYERVVFFDLDVEGLCVTCRVESRKGDGANLDPEPFTGYPGLGGRVCGYGCWNLEAFCVGEDASRAGASYSQ